MIGELRIPPTLAIAHAALRGALDARQQLVDQMGAAERTEPEAARAVAASAERLEAAETDLALATEENFPALRKARDDARTAAEQAQAERDAVGRRRRGLAARLADADDAIEAALREFRAPMAEFRVEAASQLRAAMIRSLADFLDVLEIAHALKHAGALDSAAINGLKEVRIPDIAAPRGAPIGSPLYLLSGPGQVGGAQLVAGNFAFSEVDGIIAPRDLADFGENRELAELIAALAPLGRAEVAATTRMRTRQFGNVRTVPTAPAPQARPRDDDEITREAAMTDDEYRARRAAEINKNREYPAPAIYSFSRGARP
jgi:hypothetical protein